MKVLAIIGTRPEVIKMAPVILEFKKRGHNVIVCWTRQHDDMAKDTIDALGIKVDFNINALSIGALNRSMQLGEIVSRLSHLVNDNRPDIILIQGDTISAVAGSIVGFYNNIETAHIEAGLRTYDKTQPFPEEYNRVLADLSSTILFPPTQLAFNNLETENLRKDNTYIVGNTELDAIEYIISNIEPTYNPIFDDRKHIIITTHRSENIPNIGTICNVAIRLAANKNLDVIIMNHKNPSVSREIEKATSSCKDIRVLQPMAVHNFVHMLAKSYFVITDSGGLVEGCSYLGIPAIITRNVTERIEAVDARCAILAGVEFDSIYNSAMSLLNDSNLYNIMAKAKCPFGEGNAAVKIANIIEQRLGA